MLQLQEPAYEPVELPLDGLSLLGLTRLRDRHQALELLQLVEYLIQLLSGSGVQRVGPRCADQHLACLQDHVHGFARRPAIERTLGTARHFVHLLERHPPFLSG